MSLFIRCQWRPAPHASAEARIAEVVSVLRSEAVRRIAGDRWYRLGMSKAKALARPVELTSGPRAWRKSVLTEEQVMYRLEVWNGDDGARSANLSSIIHEPSEDVDLLVITLGEITALESSGTTWDEVLAITEATAKNLGGRAIVSSRELREWAAQEGVDAPEEVAYAACWGVDRSGMSPYHEPLTARSLEPPYCSVACTSWEETRAPDPGKLANTAALLASLRRG